jgi:hypothetical protein
MIETKIYCYLGRHHISGSAMKLFILLTFCLEFVVCRDRLFIIYPPNAPLESGSAWRPAIYQSAQAVPEEFLSKESEETPIKRKGIKDFEN